MSTVRKTITVTEKQDKWIKSQVSSGDYTNESEYIRDLLRRKQEEREYFIRTKAAIQEGLESGVSDKNVLDIWNKAEERYKERNDKV